MKQTTTAQPPTTKQPPATEERLLRLQDVMNMTGMARSTIYEMIGKGHFPRHLKAGRSSLWRLSAVRQWMDGLAESSAKEVAA